VLGVNEEKVVVSGDVKLVGYVSPQHVAQSNLLLGDVVQVDLGVEGVVEGAVGVPI